MMRAVRLAVGCMAVLVAAAGQVQGAIVLFSNRGDFEAATTGLSFEGFNDFFSSPATLLTFADFTVTGTNFSTAFSSGTSSFVVSEGARAIQYTSSSSDTAVTFSFTDPINMFGIDINDWGTFGSGTLRIVNDTASFGVQYTGAPNLPSGNTIFFGVIDSEPFSSVTIRSNTQGDVLGLDALAFGTIATATSDVPEPSSLALWSVIAFAGLGIVYRRRKQHG